jgi:putative flippase GtrA
MAEQSANGRHLVRLLYQCLRFGVVGGLATAIHLVLFAFLIELLDVRPFWANFPAFAVALVAGFVGHRLWTFRCEDAKRNWRSAFPKFAGTALFGLALNSSIVSGIEAAGLGYGYSMVLMATLTPAAIFLISKFWAFA